VSSHIIETIFLFNVKRSVIVEKQTSQKVTYKFFFYKLLINFGVFFYFRFRHKPRTNFKKLTKKLFSNDGIYI